MQAFQQTETPTDLFQSMSAVLRLAAITEIPHFEDIPLFQKMLKKMNQGEKLTFLLPAFPAKSPSPLKTSGQLPDLGEVLGLMNLQKMCESINEHYLPGAEVLICSDGRVFSDVVDVSDDVIDLYADGISEIIQEFQLTNLRTFSMDDAFPHLNPSELRALLLDRYAQSLEQVREKVLATNEGSLLFNGMHRFMIEDQKGRSLLSKTQIHREMKHRTYELMRRSDAWSQLLGEIFPTALRLSIHPHPLTGEKFGVKLLTSAKKWATPWHNVTVRLNGQFELMPLEEALDAGGTKKVFGGKYVYFEIA